MAVYILADANFCHSNERDCDLILNWNSVVNEDDLVLLFGEIVDYSAGTWERVEEIFDQLIGKKKVIGISQDEFGADKWRKITNHKCFKINGAVPGIVNGESQVITIYSYPSKLFEESGKTNNEKVYGAAPRSITGQKEVYENNILSISADDWGLTPIEYMSIPQMIDDMLLFASMENKEEKFNEN